MWNVAYIERQVEGHSETCIQSVDQKVGHLPVLQAVKMRFFERMPMDVSIIVVAWNVRELLGNCLRSVYEQTQGIEYEVIYVDNGSADGSIEMVRQKFPQVRIIENKDNKGFIRA